MKKQLLLAAFCIFGALQVGAQDNEPNEKKEVSEQTFFDKRIRPHVETAKIYFGKAKSFVIRHKLELIAGATACVAGVLILKSLNRKKNDVASDNNVDVSVSSDSNASEESSGSVELSTSSDSSINSDGNTLPEEVIVPEVDTPPATQLPVLDPSEIVGGESATLDSSNASESVTPEDAKRSVNTNSTPPYHLENPELRGGNSGSVTPLDLMFGAWGSVKEFAVGARDRLEEAWNSPPLKP